MKGYVAEVSVEELSLWIQKGIRQRVRLQRVARAVRENNRLYIERRALIKIRAVIPVIMDTSLSTVESVKVFSISLRWPSVAIETDRRLDLNLMRKDIHETKAS